VSWLVFTAMLSALDDSVGNVTRALHQRGMLNNTIIIFSTDNGGPADGFNFNDASNWPLRCVGVCVLCSLVSTEADCSVFISSHVLACLSKLHLSLYRSGLGCSKDICIR